MPIIYKYPLEIKDEQEIVLSERHQILSVGNQNGVLTLWALVDPTAVQKTKVKIRIFGTGMGIDVPWEEDIVFLHRLNFLGTVIIDPFVWHVFVPS